MPRRKKLMLSSTDLNVWPQRTIKKWKLFAPIASFCGQTKTMDRAAHTSQGRLRKPFVIGPAKVGAAPKSLARQGEPYWQEVG